MSHPICRTEALHAVVRCEPIVFNCQRLLKRCKMTTNIDREHARLQTTNKVQRAKNKIPVDTGRMLAATLRNSQCKTCMMIRSVCGINFLILCVFYIRQCCVKYISSQSLSSYTKRPAAVNLLMLSSILAGNSYLLRDFSSLVSLPFSFTDGTHGLPISSFLKKKLWRLLILVKFGRLSQPSWLFGAL